MSQFKEQTRMVFKHLKDKKGEYFLFVDPKTKKLCKTYLNENNDNNNRAR